MLTRLRNPFRFFVVFRWEMATAVAGAILGINPFDEPNVTESKENTRTVLEEFQKTGELPLREPAINANGIRIFVDTQARFKGSPGDFLRLFLEQSKKFHYVAIMAYLERTDMHDALLQQFRTVIRDCYHLATTLGYGPRFLLKEGGASHASGIYRAGENGREHVAAVTPRWAPGCRERP